MSEKFASMISIVDNLTPEVAEYQTPAFVLAEELVNLELVRKAGATTGATLYCSRIQEVLTGEALRRIGLTPGPNLYGNLLLLENLGLLPSVARFWGHGLRRLGNEARHVLRRLTEGDADLACLYAERWLVWFFCNLPVGPGLPAVVKAGTFRLAADEGPVPLLRRLDEPGFDPHVAASELCASSAAPPSPSFPALLAEFLLDRGNLATAGSVLATGLHWFPDDPRLVLLRGLHLSRDGKLDEALKCLEPLAARFPDDEETAGILGGVYKRQWRADASNLRVLEAAHKAYRTGWDRSRRQNTYLGLNAATTALWLGRQTAATQLAEAVRTLLANQDAILARTPAAAAIDNYWNLVTRAEAELILGRDEAARTHYRRAFDEYRGHDGRQQTTRAQLATLLRSLGKPDDPEGFLVVG